MISIKNKLEQAIYDRAGGGEKGEKAILRYRDYIKEHNEWLSHEYKRIAAERFSATSEKETGTSNLYTRIDE